MKKSINTGLLTFLFLCNSGFLFSQETRIELGDKYFEMKAFEKAILFYKNANSSDLKKIRPKLGDCYYYTSQPEKAVIQYDLAFPDIEKNSRSFKKHRLKYALCLLSVGQKEIIDSMKMKTYIKQKENKNLKIVKAIKIFTKIYDIEGLEPRTVDSTLKDSAVNLSINSERSDFGSYIFNDTLYFASSREKEEERKHNKKLYKWNEHPFLEIYKAAINRDESPNKIKFNPTDSSSIVFKTSGHEANLAFVNDTTIIFSGSETDKKGNIVYNNRNVSNLKLQIAKRKKNQWVVDNDSTKLSAALNSLNLENFSIGNPALSPDNKRLFFVSCAPYLSANGQSDIYYVDINVNVEKDSVMSFGEVKSVPEINTSGRESFPFVSWDGALYFSSDGIHKNKEGILQLGLGLLDIYKVDDIDEVIKNSEKKIRQDVKIRHLESPFNSPKDDFAFFMEKPKDSLYAYFSSNRIHPNAKGDDDIYRATMELSKTIQVSVKDSIIMKPLDSNPCKNSRKLIKFDKDSFKITTEAKLVLDSIYKLFKTNNPKSTIRIEAHTDANGISRFNDSLSKYRAIASRDYLVAKGIDESRITYEAYGENDPLISIEKINSLPFEDRERKHKKNRRAEFIIKNCDN